MTTTSRVRLYRDNSESNKKGRPKTKKQILQEENNHKKRQYQEASLSFFVPSKLRLN